MILQMLLALAVGAFAESPQALLDSLCANASGPGSVRYWQSTADPEGSVPVADADTLADLLSACRGLSVEPGEDELGETGEMHYVIIFPDSKWSWTDTEGAKRMVRGRTEVAFRNGRFYWRKLPVSPRESGATVSSSQTLLVGLMLTGGLAVFALLALWWAKRNWG